MIRSFYFALQFLTRLPVPTDDQMLSEREQGQSLLYYPFVGLLLGLLLVTVDSFLGGTEPPLRAVLLLVIWVMLTGALHIDGLADMADAWIGGLGSRERTLEIMKDPRCGPVAVAAVVLLLLVKFAALDSLLSHEHWESVLLAPMLGRLGLVAVFRFLPYVRPSGLGSTLAANVPVTETGWVFLASFLFCLLIAGWGALWLLVSVFGLFYLFRHSVISRTGGFTGDMAGALCEVIEATVLVVAALLI
ncbi:adenosylcobinamide-GDP ribazoletransferase [Sedimenticola sp.]|uniref:adenosylcobinamide-GDP ribazoletransferase n=1 Tax=Sedimenticola sp. TaxID=1940285 RepID=UPI003D14588D